MKKAFFYLRQILRMYCIDTEALVFMFNKGSPYGFTIHTNHINHKKHIHHGFLAPQVYLCSTSLRLKKYSSYHTPENASTEVGVSHWAVIINQVLNLGGALVRSDPTDALGLGDTTQARLEGQSQPKSDLKVTSQLE